MASECYFSMCPRHSCHTTDDGPFCHEEECRADDNELRLYATARKLLKLGYDLDELDRDNPYNNIGDHL